MFGGIIPEWITEESEKECYKEIMALAKSIHAFSVVAEDDNTKYFLLEIDAEKISDEIFDAVYNFNDGTKPLLCDVVLAHQNVEGERYVIF